MSRRAVSLGTSPLALILFIVVGLGLAWTSFDHSKNTSGPAGSAPSHASHPSRSSHPSPSSPSANQHGEDGASGLPLVDLSSLPGEAAQTVALIDTGGPFPYPDHDGGTFGNYEGLLPAESSGYYKEYTVPTPGESDRGARRIIAGADGTLYWTSDHYEHFAVIER